MVTLVTTQGRSSMDLFSRRLAEYLKVPTVHTDIYQRSCGRFNIPLISRDSFKLLLTDIDFICKLRKCPDILHLPNHHLGRYGVFLRRPFIITVHDLIRYLDMEKAGSYIHKPNLRDRLLLKLDFEGVKKAARIITPSFYTKKDVVKYLGVSEKKITVIYHGVDRKIFHPKSGRKPVKPYILYVGSEHPRKNLKTLFKAFRLLKGNGRFRDLKLVIVGRVGGRERNFRGETLLSIRKEGIKNEVVIKGFVPITELAALYSKAELLAFPSIYEGFGWPPLEAMACGCPVVSSNAASMPEILGNAAVLIDPYDAAAWCDAMKEFLTNREFRDEMISRGMEHVKNFTWEKTAEKHMKVYREVEKGA